MSTILGIRILGKKEGSVVFRELVAPFNDVWEAWNWLEDNGYEIPEDRRIDGPAFKINGECLYFHKELLRSYAATEVLAELIPFTNPKIAKLNSNPKL